MKSTQRKKIIIGYRYDPERCTTERIHEIHIQEQQLPTKSIESQTQQQLIRSLKNENLLLRAQIQLIQQKSSYKSYQSLKYQFFQLQNQYNRLKAQVQHLKNKIRLLQQRQVDLKVQKPEKNGQNIQDVNDTKYTFSPYRNLKTDELFMLKQQTNETKQNSHPESAQNNYISGGIKNKEIFNNNSSNQMDRSEASSREFSPVIPQTFFKGINTEYLYNNLRTVQSQKSQQLESQVQLGYNFSFMPKPLKKNIKTVQNLLEEGQTVRFNQETKGLSSSKDVKIHKDQSINYNLSQQTLYMSENQTESSMGKLTGLKKLPNKPRRMQKHSANSIEISDT